MPKRSSTLLRRDSQTGIYLRPVSHKAVWLRLKVRAPVFEGVEHESDLVFAVQVILPAARRCAACAWAPQVARYVHKLLLALYDRY